MTGTTRVLRRLTRLLARPRRPRKAPSKTVAVVVPLSTRPVLSEDERTSLRHLVHYLGPYDKYFLAPPDAVVSVDGFATKRFPAKFFGSLAAINNLWYSPLLFEAFADYRFILYYHLDSLVLSDQLGEWCDADLDYIGPPWIRCEDSPWVERPRVGNGGFVLVKVESALDVLYARYSQESLAYWRDMLLRNNRLFVPVVDVLRWLKRRVPRAPLVSSLLAKWDMVENPGAYGLNSDIFWADQAVTYVPEFKVASLEQGLRFGFEAGPRTCLEMNGGRMPFGCHAWPRYDRGFWEPWLLVDGRQPPAPVSG